MTDTPSDAPLWLEHGGGLDAAIRQYRTPRADWLDLSTGINPHPYPLPPMDVNLWYRLPDRDVEETLRDTAAIAYRAPSPDHVIAAPGSQALIQWLPRLWPRSRVGVIGPTYAEHAACWRAAGHLVDELSDTSWKPEDYDVLVVVNPNNPDGRVTRPQDLLTWRDKLAPKHPLLVVDEAFADLDPDGSLVPWVNEPGVVVLRSFGKFFGLAGARLGFALCEPTLAATLHRAFGPWAVAGPVAHMAAKALGDVIWAKAMRKRLRDESTLLSEKLVARGLDVLGGTALYRLARVDNARALFEHLAQQGILVRAFEDQPEWLRFGLPAGEEDFHRLDTALAQWRAATNKDSQ